MNLFGEPMPKLRRFDEPAEVADLPDRIREMHRAYGTRSDRRCRDCHYVVGYRQASRWYKCGASRITHGAATDWRLKWPACGLWKEMT